MIDYMDLIKRTWLLVMIASIVASLQGCGSAKPGNSNDLVVVEQIDSVYGGREGNNYCWASFNVDIPVYGPQVLVDSVMVF